MPERRWRRKRGSQHWHQKRRAVGLPSEALKMWMMNCKDAWTQGHDKKNCTRITWERETFFPKRIEIRNIWQHSNFCEFKSPKIWLPFQWKLPSFVKHTFTIRTNGRFNNFWSRGRKWEISLSLCLSLSPPISLSFPLSADTLLSHPAICHYHWALSHSFCVFLTNNTQLFLSISFFLTRSLSPPTLCRNFFFIFIFCFVFCLSIYKIPYDNLTTELRNRCSLSGKG